VKVLYPFECFGKILSVAEYDYRREAVWSLGVTSMGQPEYLLLHVYLAIAVEIPLKTQRKTQPARGYVNSGRPMNDG
jgi:hypothetical protein